MGEGIGIAKLEKHQSLIWMHCLVCMYISWIEVLFFFSPNIPTTSHTSSALRHLGRIKTRAQPGLKTGAFYISGRKILGVYTPSALLETSFLVKVVLTAGLASDNHIIM